MTIRKLEPQPSAPRPQSRPTTTATPGPRAPVTTSADAAERRAMQARTGIASGFEAYRKPPVKLDRNADAPSEGRGRGTNDDSVGRGHGTNDDSVGRGRGTNDDSVGRGRGTNDDSVGRGRGTNDDSVGQNPIGIAPLPSSRPEAPVGASSAEEPTAPTGVALDPAKAGVSREVADQMTTLSDPSVEPQVAEQAQFIFRQPAFQALPATQREHVVNLLSTGGLDASRAVAEMYEQGNGAMLQEVGKDGTTVLQSLDKLARSGNDPRMLNDVMFDLVNPGRIWQGRAPTCTVSTMQYELAQSEPGEYARLMAGLVADGKVEMKGGGTLEMNASWAARASQARRDERSTSEAIFQAAAMEFANGDENYLEYSQETISAGGNYRGLRGDQISTMVGELFGVKYETIEIDSDTEASEELQKILSRERTNRPVLFSIVIPGQNSNHCVSLEDVKNGRVSFRDPTTGERTSMSFEEFRKSLASVQYAPAFDLGKFTSRFRGLFLF